VLQTDLTSDYIKNTHENSLFHKSLSPYKSSNLLKLEIKKLYLLKTLILIIYSFGLDLVNVIIKFIVL